MSTSTHNNETAMLRGWFSPRRAVGCFLPRSVVVLQIAILVLAALVPTCVWAGPIDISPAQKDQLKTLASDTREKTERVRRELMTARMDLFRAYRAYDLDERKAKGATEKIGKSQLVLLNFHLDNQIDLRRILDEAQFSELCRRIGRHFGGGEGGMMFGHEEGPFDRLPDKDLLQSIGVTPDQVRRIWRGADGQERKPVIDKLRRDSKQIMELYSRYNLDEAAVRKLIDSIHHSQTYLAAANHKSQQLMRSVLSQQQFERLQEELAKRFKARGEHKGPFRRRF